LGKRVSESASTSQQVPAIPRPRSAGDGASDITTAAAELIDGLVGRPWGQVSPSVYETGRLVTLSPWLTDDARRVGYLLETQRPDGGWGAPDDGYALVPTLSATEAMLSVRARRDHPERPYRPAGPNGAGPDDATLAAAASRGLAKLFDMLSGGGPAVPDMPAVELIVPYLVTSINAHLADPAGPAGAAADAARRRGGAGLTGWTGRRLIPPRGMDGTKLAAVRAVLASGADVPPKLWHALEVAGDTARGLRQIRPEATGTIGAAPAATAAWLGDRALTEPGDPARWHLETASAVHGGPVPCGYPITVFERAWAVSWLVRAGIPVTVPPHLVLSLTAPLGPAGTPAAAGLPADADTTAGALYALSLLGAYYRPDPLLAYETETHFCTWPGEDGFSTTTNAHVIEAFGHYLREVGAERIGRNTARRYAAAAEKAVGWLRDQQRDDGSWTDRWHASPTYATACCALALGRYGGPRAAGAVERARRWAVATQRRDGSWGRWHGTAEETAYAMQVLLDPPYPPDEACVTAAARGRAYLLARLDGATVADDPPLWHDKDLYRPTAIVRAAVLAALHLSAPHTRPDRIKATKMAICRK
jgi:halimadienyl-diphosphate synthase